MDTPIKREDVLEMSSNDFKVFVQSLRTKREYPIKVAKQSSSVNMKLRQEEFSKRLDKKCDMLLKLCKKHEDMVIKMEKYIEDIMILRIQTRTFDPSLIERKD